ncbi:MAG: YeaH/YhbH family protein [Pseudobdellovibrionaceae bacterium]|nr:YeaH/YhbH family protein [Pseudobdellovibrionaceae bacterium]
MAVIVDSRHVKNAGIENRRRFIDRIKGQAKKAIMDSISDRKIGEIGKEGIDVNVNPNDISEPSIAHGKGGNNRHVHPGNKKYHRGQEIPKPNGGGGGGSGNGASASGEGEDDFVFHLSREEFLDLFFEDLELPNMTRKNLVESSQKIRRRAGYTTTGEANQINLLSTFMRRKGRLMATESPHYREMEEILQEMISVLSKYTPSLKTHFNKAQAEEDYLPLKFSVEALQQDVAEMKISARGVMSHEDESKIRDLELRLEEEEGKRSSIVRWDDVNDTRYNNYPEFPVPENKSVMFCVMDVSGSMDEEKKTFAKIFYFLLHTFLTRNYSTVDIVFIRHHERAKEVDEEEFFYSRETGGTIVSSALQMVDDIARERFLPQGYDVYMAQASDGDNFDHDIQASRDAIESILTYAQGVFYTEITRRPQQNLWKMYNEVKSTHSDNFWMGIIREKVDIAKVFRGFFAKTYNYNRADAVSAVNAYAAPSI